MAWTAPRTWVAGELVTALLMNQQIRDNMLELAATSTWTPTITSSGGGTPTYTAQVGHYRKVEKLVLVTGRILLATKGTLAAGNVGIGGLPFPVASSSQQNAPFHVGYFAGMTTSVSSLGGHFVQGGSAMQLYHVVAAGAAGTALTQVSDIGATVDLLFGGCYITTS